MAGGHLHHHSELELQHKTFNRPQKQYNLKVNATSTAIMMIAPLNRMTSNMSTGALPNAREMGVTQAALCASSSRLNPVPLMIITS